jgi:hypothetical protein
MLFYLYAVAVAGERSKECRQRYDSLGHIRRTQVSGRSSAHICAYLAYLRALIGCTPCPHPLYPQSHVHQLELHRESYFGYRSDGFDDR